MPVTIKFNASNAAFYEDKPYAVSKVLQEIAHKIENGTIADAVYDSNGSQIGSFKVE